MTCPVLFVYCCFRSFVYSLFPNATFFLFLFHFTAASVKCRLAAVNRLPVLRHHVDH